MLTLLRRKPRLPVFRRSLLRRMDQAVEVCAAGILRPVGQSLWRRAEALAKEGPLSRAYVLLRNLRAEKKRRIGAIIFGSGRQ